MAYIRCGGGGIPAALKTDMNAVFNKKFETSADYPPNTWADTVNLMGALPERTASGTIATFNDGADLVPLKSLTLTVTPSQSGTGDPSPSNPRPLNSFSSLALEHTGKNMFTRENEETPAYLNSSGVIQTGGGANGWALSDYIEVKEGATYYFNPNSTSGGTAKAGYFDSSKNFVSAINSGAVSFTVPSGIKYMRFSYRTSSTDIQLEFGSSATTYEEYRTPDPHTLDLGSTVYGLTGDLINDPLDSTHNGVDLGTLSWTYHAASGQYSEFFDCYLPNDSIQGTSSIAFDGYCSIYKSIKSGNIATAGYDNNVMALAQGSRRFIVCDQRYHTKADFETAMSGVYLVYPLATPTELTTDPVEVESFKGGNNIWCTQDNSTVAVEYRADIDLLITELGG